MQFWQNFDERERKLVTILGVLICLGLVWLLGVRPLQAAKAKVERGHITALNEYRIVAEGAPKLSGAAQNGALERFDRNALVATARAAQLPITRVQPGQDGELRVWFEDVASVRVYSLLSTISSGYDVTVTRAQINRRDDDRVSAQFTFTSN